MLSVHGTKRTFQSDPRLSAFGQQRTKVDFGASRFVRFCEGFRMPARDGRRRELRGWGRRSKTSKGGNRGRGYESRDSVFSENALGFLSVSNFEYGSRSSKTWY
jgi:hypothetical protein